MEPNAAAPASASSTSDSSSTSTDTQHHLPIRLFGVTLNPLLSSSSSSSASLFFPRSAGATHLAPDLATALYSTANNVAAAGVPLPSSSSEASPSAGPTLSGEVSEGGGLMGGGGVGFRERKKGVAWTEEEHRQFLVGLKELGKGDWRGIAREFVKTRTATQVASHAQKFFLRHHHHNNYHQQHRKRRTSLFDIAIEQECCSYGACYDPASCLPRPLPPAPTPSKPPHLPPSPRILHHHHRLCRPGLIDVAMVGRV